MNKSLFTEEIEKEGEIEFKLENLGQRVIALCDDSGGGGRREVLSLGPDGDSIKTRSFGGSQSPAVSPNSAASSCVDLDKPHSFFES